MGKILEICPKCSTFNHPSDGVITCRRCGVRSPVLPPIEFAIWKRMLGPWPWVLWRDGHLRCPYCRGWIRREATVCRHCQRELAGKGRPS